MPIVNLEFEEPIASVVSTFTINYFQKVHADGGLVLRPAFQRNLVWNSSQQSFLVDSILRGLPVPEVYVQTNTSADGDEETIIVDGQQRITTCLRFISEKLRLSNDEDLDENWRGKIFSELDPKYRLRFRSFNFIVRRLPDLGDDVLREVFRRLNKTVEPLEPQELRHAAYTGPFVKLVEQLASRRVFGDLGLFSSKDYLRRRNDEFMAEVAFAVASRAFPNKKDGLDDLFVTYEKQGIPSEVLHDLERRFGRVLKELEIMASQLRKTRFRNKSDFYSLLIFLSRKSTLLPLNEKERTAFANRAAGFSELVNLIKREEADGKSVDYLKDNITGAAAMKYLRAVERAASDRLNRVRREEVLQDIFGPGMDESDSAELTQTDANWRTKTEVDDDDDTDELEGLHEKKRSQRVLLDSRQDEF